MNLNHRISMTLAAAMASAAGAQPTTANFLIPNQDRWNYPFNVTPGFRSVATIFSAADAGPGFDDRDAQFVIGFDTASLIPAGAPATNYQVSSMRLTAYLAAGDQMTYDTTYDSYRTHLLAGDPNLLPDTDPGRPVELFGTGYRNGFDLATWTETSPFGGAPVIAPTQGARNIFPASFALDGTVTDLSNNIKDAIEVLPVSIGTIAGLTPGSLVPLDSQMIFDLDLSDPGFVRFVQQSLAAGSINLVISGLQFAIGGPNGGAGVPQYPVFYTSNDAVASILGLVPTLEVVFEIRSPIDFNGDGIIDNGDISTFVSLFLGADLQADVNADGVLDNGDISTFVELFLAAAG